MKQFLTAVMLVLYQFAAAQSVQDLVFKQDLVKVNARIDSLNRELRSGGGSRPDTVKPNPDTRPECATIGRNPKILAIANAKSNSLLLQFDANNVSVLQYEIKGSATVPIFTGTKEPNSPFVELTYPAQPNGSYTLKIRGYSCKSPDDSKVFEIKTDQGGGTPVDPVDPTDPSAPPANVSIFPLVRLTEGFKEHMTLQIRDSADVRLISDLGTESKGDGYLHRYMINGDVFDSETRIKNYVVAGNNHLRVLMGRINKKYLHEGFNKWGTGENNQYGEQRADGTWTGWFQPDAAQTFSFNTSYAFQTFVAKGKQDAKGFFNHITQNYDPSDQQISWGDIGEEIKLPEGHFWLANWRPWGIDKVTKLGVTHFPHHELPWNEADGNREVNALKKAGRTCTNYQRIETVFGRANNGSTELWPNGTSKAYWPTADGLPLDEAKEWGWKTPWLDAIWLSEMSENISWQPSGSPMFGAFYPELRKRYDQEFAARGIPYEIIHNYFWLGGESLSRNHGADYFKGLFRKSPAELPRTEFSPGGTLSATTMIVEAVYLNAPDGVMRFPTQLAFRLEYFKQMGYHAGVVLAGQAETRPNNRYKIRFPDGDYYKSDKFPIDPNVHIACGFLAQVYGNFFAEWGGSTKTNQKLFDGRPGQQLFGDWFPKGSPEPRNHEFDKLWQGKGDIYGGFTGSSDLTYFSQRLYAKTFGVTDGGTRAYLRFRVDGGQWIQAKNFKADDIIDAFDQSRGWVFSQSKDGKIAWFYHNSFADNNWHVLDVELPNGKIVSNKVAGNGIHAKIE